MENGIEAYLMFLGRSGVKQDKAHDIWDNTILIIIPRDIMVTSSIIKRVNVKS
jgi:hypothetical protein